MAHDLREFSRLAKRRNGCKVHIAMDTLGHLLAVKVTAANEQGNALMWLGIGNEGRQIHDPRYL